MVTLVGESQPDPGQGSCDPCPAGMYCRFYEDPDPQPCPPYHYCPIATVNPIECPNGTFTYDNDTMLKKEDECRPCPAGYYCRYGPSLFPWSPHTIVSLFI